MKSLEVAIAYAISFAEMERAVGHYSQSDQFYQGYLNGLAEMISAIYQIADPYEAYPWDYGLKFYIEDEVEERVNEWGKED